MARPSKRLDPETQQKMERALRAGGYLKTAAAHAGVDVSTVRRWMRRDRRLREDLMRAEADGQLRVVGGVVQGAATNPGAGIKFLQVRYPALYGAHRQGLSGNDPEAVDAAEPPSQPESHRPSIFEELSPEWQGEYVSLVLAARRGDTRRSWHAARLTDPLEDLRESVPPMGIDTGDWVSDSPDRPSDELPPGMSGSIDDEGTSTE